MKNKKIGKIISIAVLSIITLVIIGLIADDLGIIDFSSSSTSSSSAVSVSSTSSASSSSQSASTSASSSSAPSEDESLSSAPQVMLEDMDALFVKNSDIVGWLTIEDTAVDYPVMYNTDENGEYYLYRNFEKDDDVNGSVFIDKNCNAYPRTTNLLLHGHSMADGSMFGSLLEYKNEYYFERHPQIKYKTLYEEQVYDIFAVFVSEVFLQTDNVFKYYKFYNAENEQQYKDYVDNCKALSLYDTGVTPEYESEILTLSTCEYSGEMNRMVITAVRVK